MSDDRPSRKQEVLMKNKGKTRLPQKQTSKRMSLPSNLS